MEGEVGSPSLTLSQLEPDELGPSSPKQTPEVSGWLDRHRNKNVSPPNFRYLADEGEEEEFSTQQEMNDPQEDDLAVEDAVEWHENRQKNIALKRLSENEYTVRVSTPDPVHMPNRHRSPQDFETAVNKDRNEV